MAVIAIIDDDKHINDMLADLLGREGYGVLRAYSGRSALDMLSENKPDLVLLDLMMPGLSGEEVLPKIKGIPVIVMSAKADVQNKVSLLLDGAADYITKPFDTRELLARITVQLRKSQAENSDSLTYGGLTLRTDLHEVYAEGNTVRLTKTEFAILKLLMLAEFYGAIVQQGITPEIEITETRVERVLDKTALKRIFGNIIGNAVKYSGDLFVTLAGDGTATFSNTAEGLNSVTVGKLFDRFYTVETGGNSTGLGLSIAKLLAEQMGGTITAEYIGSRVVITLKFAEK